MNLTKCVGLSRLSVTLGPLPNSSQPKRSKHEGNVCSYLIVAGVCVAPSTTREGSPHVAAEGVVGPAP